MPYLIRIATSYNAKNKLEECLFSVCHPMEFQQVESPEVFDKYLTSLVHSANAHFKRCKPVSINKYPSEQAIRPGVDRKKTTKYCYWVSESLQIVLEPINEQLDISLTLAGRIFQITESINS